MLYHRFMIWYYGWKQRQLIRKMRKAGKLKGLPSLERWTDEQIIKGICLSRNYKSN